MGNKGKARQGIDSLSSKYQRRDHYNILVIYLGIGARLEIRDCEKFYLSLKYAVTCKREDFFEKDNYEKWLTIQQQYQDMRSAIFPFEPESKNIRAIKYLLSENIMREKFEEENRLEMEKSIASSFQMED